MENIALSIIIPCYNEGNKLIENVKQVIDFMNINTNISNYEILIVNDGSSDNTHEVGNSLEKEYDVVRNVGYMINKGKGGAVKEGIRQSRGEWVIFMDADLSTKLKAINNVLEDRDKYDVIIGSRRHKDTNLVKQQDFTRRFIGKTCSVLTNLIIPLHISDTQCGFKAFKGDLARRFIEKQELNGFAFDVELLYIAKLNNCTIGEFGVEWENDEDSRVSVFNSSINFFIDLFKIRRNKHKYRLLNPVMHDLGKR